MTFADAPIAADSFGKLNAGGLRLGLVDTSDRDAFAAWIQADSRGFHEGRVAEKQIDEQLQDVAYRRTTGVWDDSMTDAATPVATVSSWPTPLTLPGETSVSAWAISSVTVAPTHQRRGIARALLEAELRTAHSLGIPLAILTVSEATIYSRFGFAPTTMTADLEIDTRRASWTGPAASGRVQFISLEQLQSVGRGVAERARRGVPGEIELDDYLWGRLIGLLGDAKDEAKNLRAVIYHDAAGAPQGFALYRLASHATDFAAHTATVEHLCTVTDDAYAGLWRYLLELPLVTTVSAPLRSVDEPLIWQVTDSRAVRTTHRRDHLWARILDVTAALEARRYSAPGRIALDVTDRLGFAHGRVLIAVDATGTAQVSPLDGLEHNGEAPADAASLALTVNDLGALYLGGVSARTLVRAGRITELRPGSADAVDATFHSPATPWLSSWF
ncbi:GNAT family N-acetyltransferase [Leifsonia kafniensis]|uniref:GNAT family N-acetyltransferase n=1 Tax=Leifsonia kafniensis TaxID=475957 RepID=A0ABP7KU40_9MICO